MREQGTNENAGSPRPNVLFVMTDQLRWDAIGVTGGWVRTPHLDRIAAEGICFNQCVTNSPVCIPARVSLATGMYPHNTGVCRNVADYDMPPKPATWMAALRSAGYRTSLFGKTHLHRHSGDLRDRLHLMHAYGVDDVDEIGGPRASMVVGSHMSDEWKRLGLLDSYIRDYEERFAGKPFAAKPSPLPLEQYADVYVGQKAREYLEQYDRDEPWFCMVSFGGPHEPWDAPEPYASMYDPAEMPKPYERPLHRQSYPKGLLDQWMRSDDRHSPAMSEDDVAAMRANYAGNVTLIDEQIGGLLRMLEQRKWLDRTIIVFTSDHGEMNGDYGLIYKECLLSSAVRIPLIVRLPDSAEANMPRGVSSDAMVELFDVGPTLVELTGAEWSGTRFARSLVPVLKDPAVFHRKDALVEVHGEYMLQDQEWKLVVNSAGEPYLLFHLAADPEEQHNLVADRNCKLVLDAMQIRLMRRLAASQRYQSDLESD